MASGRSFLTYARALDPGSFAAVMATGVVSIDAIQHGMPWLAHALFVVNVVAYIVLCTLSVLRVLRFRVSMIADFVAPLTSAGFLTFVAGTCVLAAQCLIVLDAPLVAGSLGLVGATAWVILTYSFFVTMITRPIKRGLARSINGGWLVVVVATQSVAVVAILLSASTLFTASEPRSLMLFAGLCLYLIGAGFYLLIITLLVYRMIFLAMRARDFTPPYWINMGAIAITALAGSLFALHAPNPGPLAAVIPFVKGFTLFFWATATWWIPLLLLLEVWRHLSRQVPLRYEVAYWNIVFPIAMYTVGTHELARALDLDFLLAIPAVGVYISLLAWLIVATALLMHVMREGSDAGARRSRKA